MRQHSTRRFRWVLPLLVVLILSLAFVHPFAAQQGPPPPYDEAQTLANMTRDLQLNDEQAAKLREILAAHRAQFTRLNEQARGLPGNGANPNDLRAAYDRERRAVAEALMPALRPEQQARLRAGLAAPNGPPPVGSPIQPLKPNLPTSPLAAGERLIALSANAPQPASTRNRRTTAATQALTEDQKILQLLNRAGFGPRPGDVERVRQLGIERYLDEQLHPEDVADDFLSKPLMAFNTLQMSTPEIMQTFMPPPPPPPSPTPTPTAKPADAGMKDKAAGDKTENQMMVGQEKGEAKPPNNQTPANTPPQARPTPTPPPRNPQQPMIELQQVKLLRAVFSERQLQEVMTDFWFNHFNVFSGKDAIRWALTSYERDVIRPHALGKFKELLLATAQSPAMLYYLDNFLSQAEQPLPPPRPNAAPGGAGIGTGTPPGNPNPPPPQRRPPGLNENYGREIMELHTLGVDGGYTQKDVTEVARCLTGWTITQQPNVSFVFRPRTHDRGEKMVLGTRIAAGGGIEDGLRVIDLLAHHPSTAHFISRKLCQRFVTDDPPAALVDRIAKVFTKTDGDIREMVRTILTSPEFYSPKYYRNKIKSPLEVVASAIRATGASTDAAQPMVQWVGRLGEPLYQQVPPTGYAEDSMLWLNTATLLERMNFAVAFAQNRINGTRVEVSRFLPTEAFANQDETLNRLLALLVHSDVAAETRAVLSRELEASRSQVVPANFDERAARQQMEQMIGKVTALIIGAREFQVK